MRIRMAMVTLALALLAVQAGGCGLLGVGTTAAGIYAIVEVGEETETEYIYPPDANVVMGTVSASGIEGGRVTALGGDDTNGLNAGTYRAGIFKSTAGGAWTASADGFNRNLSVTAIVVDPNDVNNVVAATGNYYAGGIYRSLDAGATWEEASTGLTSLDVRCLTVVPGSNPAEYVAGTAYGLFHSADGAATWTALGTTGLYNLSISAIAIDTNTNTNFYVATRGGGVFLSADSGATWTQKASGMTDLDVSCLGGHFTATTTTLYAGFTSNGVWRSTDGGDTWTEIGTTGTNLPDDRVLCLAVDQNNADLCYAGTVAGLYLYDDGNDEWDAPTTTAPSDNRIIEVMVDPLDSTQIYAGGYSGGVFRSTNSAATFATHNTGLVATIVDVLEGDATSATTLYAGSSWGDLSTASSQGPLYTINSGTNWTAATTVPVASANIRDLAAHDTNTDDVYAAVRGAGVWFTTDGGTTYTDIWPGTMTTESVLTVCFVDSTGGDYVLAGTEDEDGYYTDDGGTTWTACTFPVSVTTVYDFAVDPSDVNTIFAATEDGVYVSTDKGVNFTAAGTLSFGAETPVPTCVLVDPDSSLVVYVGTAAHGMYLSTDGGTTFSAANQHIEGASNIHVYDLVSATATTLSYVYIATNKGLYLTDSKGQDWRPIHDDDTSIVLENKRRILIGRALYVRNGSETTLWVGTDGRGLYQIALTLP